MLVALAERIKNGVNNQKGLFDSVVGQLKTYEKRWIVDIDTPDFKVVCDISNFITSLNPVGSKSEAIIPTRSGYHLITKKFDLATFKQRLPEFDVQKKNPTLLYYPSSLDKL